MSPSTVPTSSSSSTTRHRSDTPSGGASAGARAVSTSRATPRRKREAKRRCPPLATVDRDPRAVAREDPVRHREPEPGALRPLGGEERIEDLAADGLGNPDADIGDRHHDHAVLDRRRQRQRAAARASRRPRSGSGWSSPRAAPRDRRPPSGTLGSEVRTSTSTARRLRVSSRQRAWVISRAPRTTSLRSTATKG